jgi:tetratricopeptide (TPR) repeat protein
VPPIFKRKSVWVLLVLLLTGIAAVSVYFYLHSNAERALLEKAEDTMQSGDIQGALKQAQALHQRNPKSVSAARLIARGLERFDARSALPWWKRTWELKPDDFEAYTRVLSLSMNAASQDEILKLIDEAHPDFQKDPGYHKLSAVAYLKIRMPDAAHASFSRALELSPNDWEARLGFLLIEAQSLDEAQAQHAFSEILQLTEPGHPAEAQALFNLVTSNLNRHLSPDQLIKFTDRYLELPARDYSKRLKLALEAASRHPAEKDRWWGIIEAEARDHPAYLSAYGHAMNQIGESSRILRLQGLIESRREEFPILNDLFLDTLILEKRWPEVIDWVETVPEALKSPWHQVVREVARQNGQWQNLDRERLRLSLQQRQVPAQLHWISNRAKFHQWDTVSEAALWTKARIPGPEQQHAVRELFEWFQSRRDGRGLYLAAELLLKIDPDSLIAKATVAHLSLCLDVQAQRAHRLAKECHEKAPQSPQLRMIRMLSLHLQDLDAEAFNLLSQFTPEDRQLEGMRLYLDFFEWISGQRHQPPNLENPGPGYLDLEITLLRKLILELRPDRVSPLPE